MYVQGDSKINHQVFVVVKLLYTTDQFSTFLAHECKLFCNKIITVDLTTPYCVATLPCEMLTLTFEK